MEYETILKQTEHHAIPGAEHHLRNDLNAHTPSDLNDLHPFTASGYFATRKWCKENAQIIRYLQSHTDLYMQGGRFWEYPFVFKRVMERPGSRIVDIGIGEGVLASILSEHGHHVIGVDNYDSCWGDLKRTMDKTGVPCVNADARNLSVFKDEQFDIALLISVIEHIPSNTIWCEKKKTTKTGRMLSEEMPEKLKVITEALRVVRSNGLVILTSDIYLDYPPDMNISWQELIGVEGIDRENFSDLKEIYLSDNPIHKGRVVPVGIVIEKNVRSINNRLSSMFKTDTPQLTSAFKNNSTDNTNVDSLLTEGEDFFACGKYDQAKICFKKALLQNPIRKEVLNNMGVIAFTEGHLKEAETCFKKAVQIDDDYFEAIENLGKCAEEREDYTSAVDYYEKALELDNENVELLNTIGKFHLQLENFQRAHNAYKRSIKIRPQQVTLKKILSELKILSAINRETVQSEITQPLNIGFLSVWYERGQAYVTKMLRDVLASEHRTFVLARTGAVYPNQPQLKTTGFWNVPNLTTYDKYEIPPERFKRWICENQLNVVFFNEEYSLQLVQVAKECGVKTIGYYVWELFSPNLVEECNELYDQIIAQTDATYVKFRELGLNNLVRIKWGVNQKLFKHGERAKGQPIRFFHPAGWGGNYERRGTQYVIDAFKLANLTDAELLIHSQYEGDRKQDNNIIISHGTVSREEIIRMYQQSDIVVLPSKWEGLGLTFLEAIGCRLPIITGDAPPMNEFVINGETGFLCRIVERKIYSGIFVEGVHVDLHDMSKKMRMMMDPNIRLTMQKNIKAIASNYSMENFKANLTCLVSNAINCRNENDRHYAISGSDIRHRPVKTDPHKKNGTDLDHSRIETTAVSQVHGADSHLARLGSHRIQMASQSDSMKILYIAVHHHEGWGLEYFVNRAFEKTGQQTICIDFRKNRDNMENLVRHNVMTHDPDIILLQRGDNFNPEIFKDIRKPTVFWATELLSRTSDQNECIKSMFIDHVFLHSVECLNTVRGLNWRTERDSELLQNGFDDTLIRSIPNQEKDIDVLFIGHLSNRRRDILNHINNYVPVQIVSGVYGVEFFKALKRAKIVLNIHFSERLDLETRIFEALGAESCVITEKLTEDAEWIDLDKKSLIEVEHFKEIPGKIMNVLKNKELLEDYWKRAKRESRKHTVEKRVCDIILNCFNSFKKKKSEIENNLFTFSPSQNQKTEIGVGEITKGIDKNNIIYYIPRWFFPANFGDSILSTALIRPIRNRFPDRKLVVVCDDFLSEVFETNPFISGVRRPHPEEICHVEYWKMLMDKPSDSLSIWPEWHSQLLDFLRLEDNLSKMITAPDKNMIVCNYLFQNGFHPLDTKDTIPRIYLTEADKEWARNYLSYCSNQHKVCIVVSERRRSELRADCSPLRYPEESWRRFVKRLKSSLGDIAIFEAGNPVNYGIGDYFIPHMKHIRQFAAVLSEMDIGVMSDGGIHHMFNAIDKPYVLFQAYECNPPELYIMQANGAFDPDLHMTCRFQCHLFSKILNLEDESQKCKHACYQLDPDALADFTANRLLGTV